MQYFGYLRRNPDDAPDGNFAGYDFWLAKLNQFHGNFQNAEMAQLCHYPYFIFVATRDIEPGSEIWVSYGPHYDYDKFMRAPEVRDFFCGLLKVDCRKKFDYAH